MNHIKLPADDTLWRALTEVNDPEFPISVVDMGLVRTISREAGGGWRITPGDRS